MIKQVLFELLNGDARNIFSSTFKQALYEAINIFIYKNEFTNEELDLLGDILHIGNIVYNDIPLDDDQQPIENGVYDLLLKKYEKYRVPQVGAEPIQFTYMPIVTSNNRIEHMSLVTEHEVKDDMLFQQDLFVNNPVTLGFLNSMTMVPTGYKSDKSYRLIGHNNPTLVGTLDKAKYVLNAQAIEKGAYDDPAVSVFERDFIQLHMQRGLITPNTLLKLLLELKYDGVSVVVTVRHGKVVAAVSRGDTGADEAVDYTPKLYGFDFYNLPDLDIDIDVKCEAVMTYSDLARYNAVRTDRKDPYKNCRSAVSGLLNSIDGYLYQNFVTLVPLSVAATNIEDQPKIQFNNRLEEIQFINKYLYTREKLRYAYVEGTYEKILFYVKRFVEEAEYVRPLMPIMYDGVVVTYDDIKLKTALGRENFINKYAIAIKFNALKKFTTLMAVSYTVGQDGTITPMAHYEPVEFLGTIHTKSSISSLARFEANRFKLGNVVEVEYRNDVMPYLTTPDIDVNEKNPNPIIQFTRTCPVCGTDLVISNSGKSAKCPNLNCKGRAIARMANMMDKLGLKNFAEASMEKINKTSLTELFDLERDQLVDILGEVNSEKFVDTMKALKTEPIYDFQIIGALGFSGIAQETWKKIFKEYTLSEILGFYYNNNLGRFLISIKGLGPTTVETILSEFEFFLKDIIYINTMSNVNSSKGLTQKKIRITGLRDDELFSTLVQMGYDASDKSVTKDTDILLIPDQEGYTSSKMSKVGVNTLIVKISDFKNNMQYYLSKL